MSLAWLLISIVLLSFTVTHSIIFSGSTQCAASGDAGCNPCNGKSHGHTKIATRRFDEEPSAFRFTVSAVGLTVGPALCVRVVAGTSSSSLSDAADMFATSVVSTPAMSPVSLTVCTCLAAKYTQRSPYTRQNIFWC